MANLEITDLRQIDGEDALIGRVQFFGVDHHFFAVRVVRVAYQGAPPTSPGEQLAKNDPYGRLIDLCEMTQAEGAFVTVEIPGYPGEWVCWVEPFTE